MPRLTRRGKLARRLLCPLALPLPCWLALSAVPPARAGLHAQAAGPSASAQWTRTGPRGGIVAALAVSPSAAAVVYAYVQTYGKYYDAGQAGLYKTTDAGAHWAKTAYPGMANSSRRVLSLAVDPTNPSVVYAGTTTDGIFKTANGGAAWAGPFGPTGRGVLALDVDPVTPTTLYASFAGLGLYKSTNGGVTWTFSGEGIQFFITSAIKVDPSDAAVVYAAGGPAGPGQFGGVYKSTDAGVHWTRMNSGLPLAEVLALTLDPTHPSTLYLGTSLGVFKSVDGGASWAASRAGLPPGAQITSLAVKPDAPSTLFATGFNLGGIFRSTNAGASWALAAAGDTKFNSVVADAAGARLYAASVGVGVLQSDGGGAWAQSNEGLPYAGVRQVIVDTNDPARVYAATGDGVYRSPDRGASWGAGGLFEVGRPIMGLVADPTEPLTLYAAPDYVGVFKTTDGGTTWSLIRDAENRNVNTLAIDPTHPSDLYFSTLPARLFKSTDGGARWDQIGSPGNVTGLAVDPADPAVVYAAGDLGLFKSADGGAHWAFLPGFGQAGVTEIRGLTIDPSQTSTLYAFTKGSAGPVQKSTDGGATWQTAAAGLPATSAREFDVSSLVVDPLTPSLLYASCYGPAAAGGGVYRSEDGGATWSLFQKTTLGEVNSLALDLSGATLYAGTDRGVFQAPTAPPRAVTFSTDLFRVGEAAGSATVTVTRASTAGPLTVDYATGDGSAKAGVDYAAGSGSLTFAAGEATKSFTVPVLDDALDEFDEGVRLTLTAAGGAPAALARASLLVVDDDRPPTLSVGDVSAPEGDFEPTDFVFHVTLSAPSGKVVSAELNDAGGTATPSGDYLRLFGPVRVFFAPGETDKTVAVRVNGDLGIEPNETFFVNAANVVNAAPGDLQGRGTILNDDAAPTVSLSINDVTVLEGNAGHADAVFTVRLSAATPKTVKVDYHASGGGVPFTTGTLTFAPGETTQTFAVQVFGDTVYSGDRQVEVTLSDPRNARVADGVGLLTILNDELPPTVTIKDAVISEGHAGEKEVAFLVMLSTDTESQVFFQFEVVPGTAASGQDYTDVFGGVLFGPGSRYTAVHVPIKGDRVVEPNETFFVRLSGVTNAALADGEAVGTIMDDDSTAPPAFEFGSADFQAPEGAGVVAVYVARSGSLAAAATVDYATQPGEGPRSASERADYTAAAGTLRFAPGEGVKTFSVLLTDDARAERDPQGGDESFNLVLSNPTGGATLGARRTAAVTIIENDSVTGTRNPVDADEFFVRQHYHDFLNREPDEAGLDFWTNNIESCGDDQHCRDVKRVNVSAAFFLSIEFQETGYLAYRAYKAAYGDTTSPNVPGTVPVIRMREFIYDTRQLGDGVQVGIGDWQRRLESNKNAYALQFVRRARFAAAYPATLTADAFVSRLDRNAGGVLSAAEKAQLVSLLGATPADAAKRAAVFLKVAEHATLRRRELNRAFVLMQYFGYLRRNPSDLPDSDFRGWRFWLDKLEKFGGDFVKAEMVRAFLESIEYRQRFGQ